jgi:hypothetical protein
MVWRVMILVAALSGCVAPAAQSGGDDEQPPHAAEVGCEVDDDCIAVSWSCCGCPEVAVSRQSGYSDACGEVVCDEPLNCPSLGARCEQGACLLVCPLVSCDLLCPGGFSVDEHGCQVCACAAEPAAARCALDEDCAQVPADCCGCARGGMDTAVPVGDVDSQSGLLDCGPDAVCPEVDVCDPAAVARCENGTCALAGIGSEGGSTACGRPDLALCPEGQACVLNGSDETAMDGLGTCVPR